MIKNIKAAIITALIIAGIVLFFFMPAVIMKLVGWAMVGAMAGALVMWIFITVRENLD